MIKLESRIHKLKHTNEAYLKWLKTEEDFLTAHIESLNVDDVSDHLAKEIDK